MAKTKTFTEQEKEQIIHAYTVDKLSAATLSAQYGCSSPTLLKNLKLWGIQPNSRKLDLTGRSFGELKVLYPAPSRNDRYTRWVCLCSCGKETEVRTDFLTSGHTTSCGHVKDQLFSPLDLLGRRFGKLVVLQREPPESQKCQCDCGNICIVQTDNLLSGNTQSCGCLKSKGELKINELLSQAGWEFQAQYQVDCGYLSGKSAKFDYAFFQNGQLQYFIEYDGEQHFVGWNHNTENLKIQQERDKKKNEWCQENNIPLIRIPYTQLDALCIDDLLLSNTKFRII